MALAISASSLTAQVYIGSQDAYLEGALLVEDLGADGDSNGMSLTYIDLDATPTPDVPAQVQFSVSEPLVDWVWEMNTALTAELQMTLSSESVLILYENGSAAITLDPVGKQILVDGVALAAPSANGSFYLGGDYDDDEDGSNFPALNAGDDTHLIWYPEKMAFLAGADTSATPDWDPALIGTGSVTFGWNCVATGDLSFVGGASCEASGKYSIATGNLAKASGAFSFARGFKAEATNNYAFAYGGYYSSVATIASGEFSFAFGEAVNVSGDYSVCFGGESDVSGHRSFAAGQFLDVDASYAAAFGKSATVDSTAMYSFSSGAYNHVSGQIATAIGYGNEAIGKYSAALNSHTTTNGECSAALGNYTVANAYASMVVGQYNVGMDASGGTPSATAWEGETGDDPVFEIGIGEDENNKANALTVYQNGTAEFNGMVVLTQVPGDVTMGAFTN